MRVGSPGSVDGGVGAVGRPVLGVGLRDGVVGAVGSGLVGAGWVPGSGAGSGSVSKIGSLASISAMVSSVYVSVARWAIVGLPGGSFRLAAIITPRCATSDAAANAATRPSMRSASVPLSARGRAGAGAGAGSRTPWNSTRTSPTSTRPWASSGRTTVVAPAATLPWASHSARVHTASATATRASMPGARRSRRPAGVIVSSSQLRGSPGSGSWTEARADWPIEKGRWSRTICSATTVPESTMPRRSAGGFAGLAMVADMGMQTRDPAGRSRRRRQRTTVRCTRPGTRGAGSAGASG